MAEPIPSAIARGPDAASPTVIKPLRAGVFVGALAAVFTFVVYLVTPLPARALSIVGADGDGLGRMGGMRMVWVPPPGTDVEMFVSAINSRESGTRVTRDGDALVIEVPGVSKDEAAQTAKLMNAGGVNFHRAVTTDAMPALTREPYLVPMPRGEEAGDGVQLEVDQWMPDEGGRRHTDYYLYAHQREELEELVARVQGLGWKLPAGTHLAYEKVEPMPEARDQRPYWRSYVIEDAPAISGDRIASAVGSYDPNTNRPIVLLDFDREGTRIFGDVTAGMVGDKLATVLAGDVVSAPIINGAIRGGRASITMGGSDVRHQERERDALVAVLKSGPLPRGGTLRSAEYQGPSNTDVAKWLARLVLALGAGLLVGLVTWALVRRTHPVWRTPEVRLPGGIPWVRLGAMLVPVIAVVGASFITAPGLDTEQLLFAVGDDSAFNLGMLGIGPLLTSYLLVELAMTIVPSWRQRRHAGPAARVPFDVAKLVLAIVIAIVQAWFIIVFLERWEASPVGLDRVLFLASMAGVTLAFALVAWVVRTYGVGNGYAALIVTGFAWTLYQKLGSSPRRGYLGLFDASAVKSGIVLAALGLVVFGVLVAAILRMRIARAGEAPLRIPASGIAPLGEAEGLISLVLAALGMIPIASLAQSMYETQIWLHELGRIAGLVTVVVFGVLWSWTFARPAVLRAFATRAGVSPPSAESWRAATIVGIGLLVAIAAGQTLLGTSTSGIGAMTAIVIAAFVLDAYDDLRGRRGRLAYVWSLHSAQHADLAAHALEKENIASHFAGANLKTVLAWFGPFAPIDVWVRKEDTPRAREILAHVFAGIPRTAESDEPRAEAVPEAASAK